MHWLLIAVRVVIVIIVIVVAVLLFVLIVVKAWDGEAQDGRHSGQLCQF